MIGNGFFLHYLLKGESMKGLSFYFGEFGSSSQTDDSKNIPAKMLLCVLLR